MKRILLVSIIALACIAMSSCHESFEQRAAREAREYTEKYCPTPVQNYARTDSVTFDIDSKTFNYYCSLSGMLDDGKVIEKKKDELAESLLKNIKENTGLRAYKKEGFCFAYILRSTKDNKVMLFKRKFTPADYNNVKSILNK